MCESIFVKLHDSNCCCDECVPKPTGWDGFEFERYLKELRHRQATALQEHFRQRIQAGGF